ncbi:MAG TPA: phage holin family protein [Casimicrobiaceae bacterium]|nr:phage holin family protein [Casimicrobiaceae bacterium]
MADSGKHRPAGGISGALSQLAGSLVALVHTRFELLTLEFEEERERAKDLVVFTVIATVFFSFALIVLSVLVVFLFWDTHPVGALVGVALVYLAIGGGALVVLLRSRDTRPFAATIAELEKDVQSLRGRR